MSDATASANSTPSNPIPNWFAVPAFTPANADKPLPPTVNKSTAADWPPCSVTVASERRTAKLPPTWKKSPTSNRSVPPASSNAPSAPAIDRVREDDGPVAIVSGLVARSSTTPALFGRFTDTNRFSACTPTSGSPSNDALEAPAVAAVHFNVGSACDVAIATANSTPPTRKPTAFAPPPFKPTKPPKSLAPIVSKSTEVAEPPVGVTCAVDFVSAKSPVAVKKPPRSTAIRPATSSSAPRSPSIDNVRVSPVPVGTASGEAAKSITAAAPAPAAPPVSGRLMLTDKLEPASETPGTPENEDDAADADNAVHFRVGSACDDANASAKSTSIIAMPTAFAVPPFTPANADNPWPPIVSRSTAVVVLEASASVTEPLERRSASDPPT